MQSLSTDGVTREVTISMTTSKRTPSGGCNVLGTYNGRRLFIVSYATRQSAERAIRSGAALARGLKTCPGGLGEGVI